MRLTFSMVSSATRTWLATGLSKVEAITSPRTLRRMFVTSSGRSSTSSTTISALGLLCAMASAIFCRITVLPERGGATISPRCPRPRGQNRSIRRSSMSSGLTSRT